MIDYRAAEEEFERYLDDYDRENDKVKLKIVHTYGVVEQSTEIAERMKFSSVPYTLRGMKMCIKWEFNCVFYFSAADDADNTDF